MSVQIHQNNSLSYTISLYLLTKNCDCSIFSTCMNHILLKRDRSQHGIHKDWKSFTIKRGNLFLDVQEKEVDKDKAMH